MRGVLMGGVDGVWEREVFFWCWGMGIMGFGYGMVFTILYDMRSRSWTCFSVV